MTSLKCPCCQHKLSIEHKLYIIKDRKGFLLSILIRPTINNETNNTLKSEAFDVVEIPIEGK